MKHKNCVIQVALLILLSGLIACTDTDSIKGMKIGNVESKALITVTSPMNQSVSEDLDNIVANLRSKKDRSRSGIYSVTPINNDKGAVIAYVLNFGDNDGYIVLSANKKISRL